jgi:hypothetical protein
MTVASDTHSIESLQPRVLAEGYGPGAWHGPDLKAAIADVTPELAYRRPAPGRHNIAEVVLHHAFFVRSVGAQITGRDPGKFVLDGEEWFVVDDASTLAWPGAQTALRIEQQKLADAVEAIAAGKSSSPMTPMDRFNLVLGITCHAVYHAGQIQLLKRLLT